MIYIYSQKLDSDSEKLLREAFQEYEIPISCHKTDKNKVSLIFDDLSENERLNLQSVVEKDWPLFIFGSNLNLNALTWILQKLNVLGWFNLNESLAMAQAASQELRGRKQQPSDIGHHKNLSMNVKEEIVQVKADDLERLKSQSREISQRTNLKNRELKNLGRFTRELLSCLTIEEALTVLRKELKSFHLVQSPVFVSQLNSPEVNLYYFQGSSVFHKTSEVDISFDSRIGINEKSDSQLLAQLLNRPVTKVIRVPLSLDTPRCVFYFCHDIRNEKESEYFLDFIIRRLQSFEVVVESIFLKQEVVGASKVWENTFEGILDPVLVFDRNYNILRSNKSFGFSHEKCFKVFAERDSPCQGCPISVTQREKKLLGSQVRAKGKLFRVTSDPIKIEFTENIVGFINHYVDQTNRNLLQEKLIQNEKMVALGHLAGHIAHELNNPLTGIRSMCQLLLKTSTSLPDQLAGDISEVEKAAQRCQKIIKNLLNFTREDDSSIEEVCLDEVINDTIPLLKVAMRNLNFECRLEGNKVRIRGNRQLLQQVVFNLVMNSCQAMEKGGELKVQTFLEKDHLALVVEDTGVGIPETLLHQIFDSFFTTKKRGVGTGLGLSMVKKIVEQFKGYIQVSSLEGKGTKFTLTFPIID